MIGPMRGQIRVRAIRQHDLPAPIATLSTPTNDLQSLADEGMRRVHHLDVSGQLTNAIGSLGCNMDSRSDLTRTLA